MSTAKKRGADSKIDLMKAVEILIPRHLNAMKDLNEKAKAALGRGDEKRCREYLRRLDQEIDAYVRISSAIRDLEGR